MNDQDHDTRELAALESGLAGLTRPAEAPPGVWRSVVAGRRTAKLTRWIGRGVLSLAAGVIVIGAAWIAAGGGGVGARRAVEDSYVKSVTAIRSPSAPAAPGSSSDGEALLERLRGAVGFVPAPEGMPASAPVYAPVPASASVGVAPPPIGERVVAVRASVDLRTPGVRGAFDKVSFLVRDELGEYVESSSLSGTGEAMQATLTLRVRPERVGDVLRALREIGEVASESRDGDDVTQQATDLDARLRNEERVEQELLALLASRENAPLQDILHLRRELSTVRESIERLSAQKQMLARRVTLATLLVTIGNDHPSGFRASNGLGAKLARAWDRGVRNLSDLLGGLVVLAVGGAPAWIGLAVLWFFVRRWLRGRTRRAAEEPPPFLSGM